jgi:hypothetical protein
VEVLVDVDKSGGDEPMSGELMGRIVVKESPSKTREG